ncbi:MAG: hypothetical protein M1399_07310 [Actinobacteria bacterium]|nr:hypothetical protein [Actinomycetota bacterium]MCL5446663.1 hypothetical protein [Actinomycetota bacterium]
MDSEFGYIDKVTWIVQRLNAARVPYAIGGALALGYYVPEPRATHDIDINIFMPSSTVDELLRTLSPYVSMSAEQKAQLLSDDQIRLLWGDVPIDLFYSSVPLHEAMQGRVVHKQFDGIDLPILSVTDLVICKSIFARPKDWVDILTVIERPDLDVRQVDHWVEMVCGKSSRQFTQWKAIESMDPETYSEFDLLTIGQIADSSAAPDPRK